MAQAEGHRVLAALGRQLVHERLDGEHVGERAERAQRRGADRHGQQAVVGDGPGGKVVERHGVALGPAAARQRRIDRRHARERLGELPGGEQRRRLGTAGPRYVPVAPDVVPPADDLALRVEIGFQVDGLRGAERRPGQLVLARPLQAHGPALHRARQQRGLQPHIVGAVLAVAAGALHVLDDDALRRQDRRPAPGPRAGCRRPGCGSTRAACRPTTAPRRRTAPSRRARRTAANIRGGRCEPCSPHHVPRAY